MQWKVLAFLTLSFIVLFGALSVGDVVGLWMAFFASTTSGAGVAGLIAVGVLLAGIFGIGLILISTIEFISRRDTGRGLGLAVAFLYLGFGLVIFAARVFTYTNLYLS